MIFIIYMYTNTLLLKVKYGSLVTLTKDKEIIEVITNHLYLSLQDNNLLEVVHKIYHTVYQYIQ